MRRMRSLLLSIGLAAALAGLTLAPVAASYPGHHNGRIAFGVRGADGANIFSVRPDGKGQKQLTDGPWLPPLPVLLAGWPHDRLLRQHERLLGDLDDARERVEAAPVDPPRRASRPSRTSRRTHRRSSSAGRRTGPEHTTIYTVNAKTGGDLHALTSCAGYGEGCFNDLPVWSPDGTKIAFIHADDFDFDADAPVNEQVWVMDADGGNPHPLTSDNVPHDQVPDWSPDGSKIAYHAGALRRRRDLGHGRRWWEQAPAQRLRRRRPVAVRRRATTGAPPGHRTARRSRSCATTGPSASRIGPSTS